MLRASCLRWQFRWQCFIHVQRCLVSSAIVQALGVDVVVRVLQQCAAGLHHLHTQGIMHRDLRAANVLVSALRPIHVVITDFGVSHQLSSHAVATAAAAGDGPAASGPGTAKGASVGSILKGVAALGPVQWMAPESLDGDGDSGRVATPASDVYLFGGLMFEVRQAVPAVSLNAVNTSSPAVRVSCHALRHQVLSGGQLPFHWLKPLQVMALRTLPGRRGLLGMNTLEAAEVDDMPLEWRVAGASPAQLDALVALMKQCLSTDPRDRPLLDDVQSHLRRVCATGSATYAMFRRECFAN